MDNNIKKILIAPPEIKKKSSSLTNQLTNNKNIISEKERKTKVDTFKWDLSSNNLEYLEQLQILNELLDENCIIDTQPKKYFVKNIKGKIQSYRQQDLLKHKFDENNFVSYNTILQLLKETKMLCHYCSCETYVLYEFVKEMKQWSLDRIDNEKGHINNNLVIACLECNLKRRRTNKDSFLFTKQLVITREGLDTNN